MSGDTPAGAWLVCEDRVLASLEVADTARARRRGLLGRDGIEGALLLTPTRSVHTMGMHFAIDVMFCDDALRVLALRTVPPWRLPRPALGTRAVIESEAGLMRLWNVHPGDQLEVRR
jgi:uncharacterized membrane protein (UPF0127 family)